MMSPLSTSEAKLLICRAGCSMEVADLADWALRNRDQTLADEAQSYFLRAGGTAREWSKIVEAYRAVGESLPV